MADHTRCPTSDGGAVLALCVTLSFLAVVLAAVVYYAYVNRLELIDIKANLRKVSTKNKQLIETISKSKRLKKETNRLLEDIELLPEDVSWDVNDKSALLGKGKIAIRSDFFTGAQSTLFLTTPPTGAFGMVLRGTYRGHSVRYSFLMRTGNQNIPDHLPSDRSQ